MAADARSAELAALRRPFGIGVVAVLAFIVAVGGIVAAFGTPANRSAGIAERWLVAVGDSTRDGIEDDGTERALEDGAPPDLADRAGLISELARADGERAFEEVRVGRAADAGAILGDRVERVPFSVTPYEADAVEGYVFLQDGPDGWDVVALQVLGEAGIVLNAVVADLQLDPGPETVVIDRPERAPIGFWLGALALGVLITVACAAAIRAATPKGHATTA